ncbi:MAG TPA: GMC family oxidoreductase [Thermoleophilaceae bacterium]|jgi:choline dehydrogenase-like flavoprotein
MRDVIVIGTGAGGPATAKELAARGLDVLMLEAGPKFDKPPEQWSRLEDDANNQVNGYLRIGPGDRDRGGYARENVQYGYVQTVMAVGGTTTHYFGNAPRAYPGVFKGYSGKDRNNYDTKHLFPFDYCTLIPYYEWAEATLPVQAAAMGTKEEIWFRGARGLGLPLQKTKDVLGPAHRPQPNAILQPRGNAGKTNDPDKLLYPEARGCTFCGHCYQGCFEPRGAPRNLAAKRSTDNSYVPMALTADLWMKGGKAASLIADAYVTKIHLDGDGAARAVDWRNTYTGETHTEEAKVIVLAGGCVENPRLWLNSGLPNPNDWVGRGATDHQNDIIIGLFPFYTGHSKGPGAAVRAEFPGYGGMEAFAAGPALQAAIATFSDAGVHGAYNNDTPFSSAGADTFGRLVGNDLRKFMEHGVDRMLNVFILADDDVEPQNRVNVSQQLPPDENGPVPRYENHQRNRSARTKRNREYMARKAVQLLRKAGATHVHRPAMPPIYVQTTMRMGESKDDSVVDANQESWFVPRLFVTDVSSIPNSLGGPNPTLTVQALAAKSAEAIFTKYFDGEPWVHREAPVVSTDRRISKGLAKRGY